MLTALAFLSLTPIAYGLTPGTSSTYYVRVGLDGFLPVLGGKQGQALLDMTVAVQGLAPGATGSDLRATSDLSDFHLKLNGAEFPVTLEEAQSYFPKSTATFTPQGHVDTNDAPDMQLPIRLPGLDPKRFPDITYVPIEFPSAGVEEGKSFTFMRPFAGVNLNYTVTPTKVTDDEVDMTLALSAHDEYLVDAAHGITTSQSDASASVVADTTGDGTATFDRKKNLIENVSVKMTTVSKETDLSTKQVTPHQLVETLDVSLDKPLTPLAFSGSSGTGLLNFLGHQIEQSGTIQRAIVGAQLVHPRGGTWGNALPLVRSAVNSVYVPSQLAIRREGQNLSVLASNAASRIPKLLNVESVHRVGSFLSGIPSVVGSHWGPYNVGAGRLADQLVEYFSPDSSSPYQAVGVRWHKNQHKPSLPASGVKPRG